MTNNVIKVMILRPLDGKIFKKYDDLFRAINPICKGHAVSVEDVEDFIDDQVSRGAIQYVGGKYSIQVRQHRAA